MTVTVETTRGTVGCCDARLLISGFAARTSPTETACIQSGLGFWRDPGQGKTQPLAEVGQILPFSNTLEQPVRAGQRGAESQQYRVDESTSHSVSGNGASASACSACAGSIRTDSERERYGKFSASSSSRRHRRRWSWRRIVLFGGPPSALVSMLYCRALQRGISGYRRKVRQL